jgi:hypothetical protein
MSLIKELQQLIQTDSPISARVISVSDGLACVSTPSGIVEVPTDENLQTGDVVTIQNGRAVKKQRGGDAPVYFV